MYYNEENTRGGLVKALLLRLLLIIIFILVLVWLFPTKSSLNPLYQGIFRDNIDSMKDAAETYFTNERLPEDVGDSVKMSLSEMLSKNLLLPFTDKNGNSCDLNKSYVEITKKDTEFELKVNLSCPGEEAFIIEHLGCTNKCAALGQADCTCNCICTSGTCTPTDTPTGGTTTGTTKTIKEYEFKKEVENKVITGYTCPSGYTLSGTTCKKEITSTDTISAIPVYESSTSNKIIGYRCDVGYTLDEVNKLCKKTTTSTQNATTNYKDETTKVNATPNYEGKTDTVSSTATYTNKTDTINATENTQTVTKYLYKYMKNITTTTYEEDKSQPIFHYSYDNVIGHYTKYVCSSFSYFVEQSSGTLYQKTGDWAYVRTETVSTIPNDTATTRYEVIGMDYDRCQNTCTLNPYFKVRVYSRSVTTISDSAYSNLSATCNVTEQQIPIYGLKMTLEGYVTNKITKTETVEAWADTWNDATLLSQNYGFVNIRKANGTTTTTTYTCPAGYTQSADKRTCSKTTQVISGYTCPAGYTKSSDERTCTKYTNTIVGYTCPAGYTQSADKRTCSKTTQVISGYTCPAGYTYDNISKNCKRTDTTTVNATPVYESTTSDKLVGYRCNSGYTLTNSNQCTKTSSSIVSVGATASYKTTYGVEYMWSESTYVAGWTRTGNERTRTVYTSVTSDNSNKQK